MKKLLPYFFLLCFVISNSQNKATDSLLIVLKSLKPDTVKAKAYLQLAREFILIGNYKECKVAADNALLLSESLSYKKGMVKAYNSLGNIMLYQGNYQNSLTYYQSGLQISSELGDKLLLSTSYFNIGNNYFQIADYPTAVKNYIKSAKYSEEIKDSIGMADSYSTIGVALAQTSDFTNAISYITKGLNISKLINDKPGISKCYNFLGAFYFGLKDYNNAIKNYELCLKINEELDSPKGISASLGSIGGCYSQLKKFDIALVYCNKQLTVTQKLGDKVGSCDALFNIGEIYAETGKTGAAMDYFNKVIVIALEVNNPDVLRHAYHGIMSVHLKNKDYKQAFEYSEKFKAVNDSIFNLEKNSQLNEALVKYEVDKKEAENKILSQQNQIQSLQLTQNKFVMWGLAGIATLILIIAVLFIRQNKIKTSQKSILLEQKLLRSQMNPHFIFNCLQAITNFTNDEKVENYLSSFGGLTRAVLESSRKDLVPLNKEVQLLENYFKLQKLLHEERFNYSINVDPKIDSENTSIPPMLAQPFIENAIEHGFRSIKSGGEIVVSFNIVSEHLVLEIRDNGIGISNSAQSNRSLATTITIERIQLFNKKSKRKASFNITEAFPLEANKGVKVSFSIPV